MKQQHFIWRNYGTNKWIRNRWFNPNHKRNGNQGFNEIHRRISIKPHDYQIEDGMKSSSYKFQLKNTYKSKVDLEDKEKLNKLITHLRVEKSLSLNEVCKELNKKKFRTPTNKEWNKSLLSLHIKNMKVDVGK